MLDVQDFSSSGEVAVQFLSECELVVEGRVEEEGRCSRSCRKFQRCFHMPGPVDLHAVTSVISADGVLTVTAPKKVRKRAVTSRRCPRGCECRGRKGKKKKTRYAHIGISINDFTSTITQEARKHGEKNRKIDTNTTREIKTIRNSFK